MNFDDFLEDCKDGDLARVRRGIAHVDLRQTNSKGVTPLIMAVSQGHEEVVKILIPGSDLRQADVDGDTALMWAAYKGCAAIAKALIPVSDLFQVGKFGRTALMLAACRGSVEIVRALLPGSDLRQQDGLSASALFLAACNGRTEVVQVLIPGSDLLQKNGERGTALEGAIKNRCWSCVDLLAVHDPEWGRLSWPEEAQTRDLPQWSARRERQAIADEIGAAGRFIAPKARQRPRL